METIQGIEIHSLLTDYVHELASRLAKFAIAVADVTAKDPTYLNLRKGDVIVIEGKKDSNHFYGRVRNVDTNNKTHLSEMGLVNMVNIRLSTEDPALEQKGRRHHLTVLASAIGQANFVGKKSFFSPFPKKKKKS